MKMKNMKYALSERVYELAILTTSFNKERRTQTMQILIITYYFFNNYSICLINFSISVLLKIQSSLTFKIISLIVILTKY